MLRGRLTPNKIGLQIQGDYFDLDSIYSTIHDIATVLVDDSFPKLQLMSLAYEIRKARDGMRDIEEVTPFANEPRIMYKCTKVILIDFLPTLSILRGSMAYKTTNETHQASVYALESLTKSSLIEADPKYGLLVWEWTQNFSFDYEKLAAPLLEMAIIDYLRIPVNHRLEQIQKILMQYFMEGKSKEIAIKNLEKEAVRNSCKPEEISFETPEFDW